MFFFEFLLYSSADTISLHLKNIFADGELEEKRTAEEISVVQTEGQTDAEIVYRHADSEKDNMGLNTWKNAPDGRILKSDVSVAKNYLDEQRIRRLERSVTGYFDYVEDLIERENVFTMVEFTI